MLGNGLCTRPVERDCRMESACKTCSYFQTSIEFKPILIRQRDHARDHDQPDRPRSSTTSSDASTQEETSHDRHLHHRRHRPRRRVPRQPARTALPGDPGNRLHLLALLRDAARDAIGDTVVEARRHGYSNREIAELTATTEQPS